MNTSYKQKPLSILSSFPLENENTIENYAEHSKPFVKWVGGKTQILPELQARLPHDFSSTVTTYIEPFIGGGAFFFYIASHFSCLKKIIINDANPALINAYRVIQNYPDKLIAELRQMKEEYNSLSNEEKRKEYFYARRDSFNQEQKEFVDWAAELIFLNRTCFNGLYRVNSRGKFNVPHGKYSNPMICDEKTIYADHQVLKNVEIFVGDFSLVTSYADKHSFVYFDPPYRPLSATSSFCSYCEGGFDDNEQKRLAQYCRELDKKGVRWLLSNSNPKGLCPDDSFFDELYKGFHIRTVQANRMLNANPSKRGKLDELLISNFLP